MKGIIKACLVSNIPCMLCIVSAIILAYRNIDGWGWFLGAAYLMGNRLYTKTDD